MHTPSSPIPEPETVMFQWAQTIYRDHRHSMRHLLVGSMRPVKGIHFFVCFLFFNVMNVQL